MMPLPLPLTLTLLPGCYAICRFEPGISPLPLLALDTAAQADIGSFWSLTRTEQEVSLILAERYLPLISELAPKVQPGWRILRVEGPLPFEMVGVMARLTAPLAESGVALLAVATFDTDYLLIEETSLDTALSALQNAGFAV